MRIYLLLGLYALAHAAGMKSAGGGGCATAQKPASSSASVLTEARPLAICVPPVRLLDGSTRAIDVDYGRMGLRQVFDVAAIEGCDVMVAIIEGPHGGRYRYDARSAYSSSILATGSASNWLGMGEMMGKISADLRSRFGPGTEAARALESDRQKAGFVTERPPIYAAASRIYEVEQAERAGDTALQAGDAAGAFKAWTAALQGPYSDDPASQRVRPKYMRLLATYADLPPVPEAARRHMVRAKAIIKDSTDFESYGQAVQEMTQALQLAPWWSSVYFNIGVLEEKRGHLRDAIHSFQMYLAANPGAADAKAVQDRIYGLEVRSERGR